LSQRILNTLSSGCLCLILNPLSIGCHCLILIPLSVGCHCLILIPLSDVRMCLVLNALLGCCLKALGGQRASAATQVDTQAAAAPVANAIVMQPRGGKQDVVVVQRQHVIVHLFLLALPLAYWVFRPL
jgi:hypothetical protein